MLEKGGPPRASRTPLARGIAFPVLYFAALLAGAAFYPRCSHVAQYASELGGGRGPQVAPLLILAGLRRAPDSGRLRVFLAVVFLSITVLFAVMKGVGGLVTRGNVGLWQRGNALVSIPWLGIVAYALRRRTAA